MSDSEIDDAMRKLIVQWNIAEERIKKAEQVRANEVVAAAIFELRYAGRKIIDANDLILNKSDEPGVKTRIMDYLADATEDCVKAKHDAIDSMMDFVTSWFYRTENKLGLSAVTRFFPNYIAITADISDIQDKIAEARRDRNKLRDSIYNVIDNDDYDRILGLYRIMRLSEERVQAEVDAEAADRERFIRHQGQIQYEGRINLAIGVAGVALAIIGLTLTIGDFLKPAPVTLTSPPAASTHTTSVIPGAPTLPR